MTMFVASTGMQVGGQIMAGNAANRQAKAEAQQLANQAAYEADAGKQEAGKIRKRTALDRGSAVANYAASGVRIGEGSALAVEEYIQQGGEEDAMMTLLNADRRANALRQQASATRAAGKAARNASYLQGVGSLVSAGYKATKMWPGAFDSRSSTTMAPGMIPRGPSDVGMSY